MLARSFLPAFVTVAAIVSACLAVLTGLLIRHLGQPPPVFAQFQLDTREHQPAPCPANATVIVTFGQSLAANSHEVIYDTSPAQDVYVYFSGRCFRLADPLMGATGEGGSVWIPAASKLAGLIGRPVVVIAGGVDGTAISQWTARNSPLVEPLRARIEEAKRSSLPLSIYIWMQGENDAAAGTSAASYEAHLQRLYALFNDAPWLITSNSICTDTPARSYALDQARRNFAQANPHVEVSVDLDGLGPEYRMSDRCHFNKRGQELAGTMIADAVARLVNK